MNKLFFMIMLLPGVAGAYCDVGLPTGAFVQCQQQESRQQENLRMQQQQNYLMQQQNYIMQRQQTDETPGGANIIFQQRHFDGGQVMDAFQRGRMMRGANW